MNFVFFWLSSCGIHLPSLWIFPISRKRMETIFCVTSNCFDNSCVCVSSSLNNRYCALQGIRVGFCRSDWYHHFGTAWTKTYIHQMVQYLLRENNKLACKVLLRFFLLRICREYNVGYAHYLLSCLSLLNWIFWMVMLSFLTKQL